MGLTPPTDLRIQATEAPWNGIDASGFHVLRRDQGPPAEAAWESVAGPFKTYPDAVLAWRIAAGRTDPAPTDFTAWTRLHSDGMCGGDDAGCPHCRWIASQGDRASQHLRQVILASRRNLPRGLGNGVPVDADAPHREEILAEWEARG